MSTDPFQTLERILPSVRRKIALQLIVSNLSIVVNFALAIILARLLSPDDIGVFSMSAVLIAIAHTFRDFGATTYLKREKELTDQTIRTARGLLYCTSWSMALVMYLSSTFWAKFFNEPRVEDVISVLALGFVFIPFGAIPQALMTRELNVTQSSKVMVISTLVYFAASVSLALLGFKHMTMAWANLINILVSGLVFNLFLDRHLPWMPSLRGWRAMASFGTANVLTALCQVVNTSIPDLVLGRLSVATDVGLFSRASATVNMVGKVIEPSISYFTLPYMARIHHTTGDVSKDYLRASSIISSVLLPVLAWVALVPYDIVQFLFGAQWMSAAPAVPWLCAATAIATLFSLSAQTVTSVGRPFAAALPLIVLITGKLLAAFMFYDGSLKSFAIAMLMGEIISIPAYIYIKKVFLKIAIRKWALDIIKIVLSIIISSTILLWLINDLLNTAGIFFRLLASLPIMIIFSTIFFHILKLPIASEIQNTLKIITK